jgi:hypothetical protein
MNLNELPLQKSITMRKIFLTVLLLGTFSCMMAQNPENEINKAVTSTLGTGANSLKTVPNFTLGTSQADNTYSLIGTAFIKSDGFTQANWDYDINLAYDNTIGSKFYYKVNRLEFLLNGEFKIRKNLDWTESYGFDRLIIEGPDYFGTLSWAHNIKVLVRKIYDITFVVDTLNNTFTLICADSPPLKTKAIINKATIAPVIDGTVDAVWSTANVYSVDQHFMSNVPTLGASGTTTWKGLWTSNGIYILIQVNDNVFFPAYSGANPGNTWEYDKPEIYLDVNSTLDDGKGPGSPSTSWWGHYQVAPDFTSGNLNGTPGTLWDGLTVYAFKVANPGYAAEYFIPFTKLLDKNNVQVVKTATMGFDITINDRDIEANPRQSAVWTNFGRLDGSWNNMDDCGTILLVGSGANVFVTGITVNSAGNASTITKEAGTLLMSVSVLPADATNKNVTWTVVNGTGQATISVGGLLTARENGTVTIVATANDGSGITGSKSITISNQYLSFADGSLIKDGGFETDGPIGGFWGSFHATGTSASVINGVCKMVTSTPGLNIWDLQVNQTGWKASNDTSYILSFTAWSDANRSFEVDFEDNNNDFMRFGSSTDPEAVNGRSDWIVPVTATPKVFTFHVTFDKILVTTNFLLNFLSGNTVGTVYIDNVSLVNDGYWPNGNGPPVAGTAGTNSTICSGTSASFSLTGSVGNIQWQQSATGTSNWSNVIGGTGNTLTNYTTGILTSTTYYRALVANAEFPDAVSNTVKITVNPFPASAGTISGTASVCLNQSNSVLYSVPAITDASSYIWTLPVGATGSSTTRSITVKYGVSAISGNLSVTGHNSCGNGLMSTLPVIVKYPFEGSEICMVTIDEETERNMVVWEKTPGVGIVSYNVYREKLDIAGQYELIGNVGFNELSVFVDTSSRPKNRQYLYKIAAVDACGNASSMSKYHKTMLLKWSKNENGVNLEWSEYKIQDMNTDSYFPSYKLWRGTKSNNITDYKIISASVNTIIDDDPDALAGRMYYRIAGVRSSQCAPAEPGKKTSAGPYLHSLSNLEDNRLQGTGVSNLFADSLQVSIYPNPFTEHTSISYTLPKSSNMKVEIYNVVGEKVGVFLDRNQSAGSHKLEITAADLNYTSGLYYLRFMADDAVIVRKLMFTGN